MLLAACWCYMLPLSILDATRERHCASRAHSDAETPVAHHAAIHVAIQIDLKKNQDPSTAPTLQRPWIHMMDVYWIRWIRKKVYMSNAQASTRMQSGHLKIVGFCVDLLKIFLNKSSIKTMLKLEIATTNGNAFWKHPLNQCHLF